MEHTKMEIMKKEWNVWHIWNLKFSVKIMKTYEKFRKRYLSELYIKTSR